MHKRQTIMAAATVLFLNQTNAGDMASLPIKKDAYVISLSSGAAFGIGNPAQPYYLDSDTFTIYSPTSSLSPMAVGELFIGLQHHLNVDLVGELGVAYGMTSNFPLSGDIWELSSPEYNTYTYNYTVNQNRVSLKGRLLGTPLFYELSPYITASTGVAFNSASNYLYTPKFSNKTFHSLFTSRTQTSFSYTLGVGLQKYLAEEWSMGLGYEFSDIGKATLGPAAGQTNDGIAVSHIYTNGVVVSLTFRGGE